VTSQALTSILAGTSMHPCIEGGAP